jgi:DNA-binding LacI/PurR family transcriptional regulator
LKTKGIDSGSAHPDNRKRLQNEPKSSPSVAKLRDIAASAGVTIATASRSLSGAYGVNPATRQRVLEAAARLHYRPNRFARGLVTGRSQIIGLIISDIRNPFFADVARGAEDAAFAAGSDVVLCNTDLNSERQKRYIHSLMEKNVDGIIMNSITALDRTEQNRLAESGVPVVLLNRHEKNSPFSTVLADNVRGGALVAQYLSSLGHERFAHLSGSTRHGNLSMRAKGFLQYLRKPGSKASVSVLHAGHTFEGGHEVARKLFGDRNEITAIFAANDAMAFGVLKAAMELGVRIPADVSLVGFDDVEMASIAHPPLTTIHQPRYELGQAAVEILLAARSGKQKAPEHRVLGVHLVERESTAKLLS